MKKLLVSLSVLLFAAPALAVLPAAKIQPYKTEALRAADNQPEGVVGYTTSSNQFYGRQQDTWVPLGSSLAWSMTFNEGASKGVSLIEQDGTAYSTTADATNVITYGYPPLKFAFATNTTATGTITPAAEALGLDLNGGSPGDNDEWTATFGNFLGTGGPAVIGTTPAFKFCATLSIHDVDGTDGLWVMLTSTGVHADLSSGDPNYTSYCGIGNVSGSIYVSDNTTGGTDTTNTWADDASKELCVLASAAGACTYTIDSVAPTVTDAHTLGDGVPHVARIQGINATNLMDDTHVVAARWAFQ